MFIPLAVPIFILFLSRMVWADEGIAEKTVI